MPENAVKNWYTLDNAAKIYPPNSGIKRPSTFRASLVLREKVDPALLQQALDKTLPRFPTFNVRMKKGLFWYYLEQNPGRAQVKVDDASVCAHFSRKTDNGFLFRVLYYNKTVSLEVFHSITDGTGAITFLKTLVHTYLSLCGKKIPLGKDILDITAPPREDELEDSFLKYASPTAPLPRREKNAYHPKGSTLPVGNIIITEGLVSVSSLLEAARKHDSSITVFLTSLLIDVLLKRQKIERRKQKPVRVSVPVNVRKIFPSRSLRNFSLYINTPVDPNYGEYTFPEILEQIKHHIGFYIGPKLLNAQMAMNVFAEKNFLLRIMPLFIKNFGLSSIFKFVGEQIFSSTLSNIGAVEFSEEYLEQIDHAQMILGASPVNPVNCTVCSTGDKAAIVFSRTIFESDIEREFFKRLVKLGLKVKVTSNKN